MAKTTVAKAVTAANILADAKVDKMETKEKFSIIRAMCHLRPLAEDYQKFMEDAAKRLRPDGLESIDGKKLDDLTDEQKALLADYNKTMNECLGEEQKREIELNIDPLPEEAFGRFADSNPNISLSALSEVMDVLADEMKES